MKWLLTISSWKLTIVLALIYILFPVFLLPWSMQEGPSSLGPLDLQFRYTPTIAYEHLDSFGPEGRAAYFRTSLIVDTAYPVTYCALFMVLTTQLLKAGNWAVRPFIWLNALPLVVFAFDLAENASILSLLLAYPERMERVARLAGTFTTLKWSSVVVFALCFSTLLLLLVKQRLQPARS